MMDPTIFDHILFAIFTLLFPLWALRFGFRRLKLARREDLPRIRRSVYGAGMALQWTLTATVILVWLSHGRAWIDLGLVPLPTLGLAGVLVGLVIISVYIVRQRNEAMIDDESLEQVRHRMQNIEQMIPRDGTELRMFFRLSVTAGICEEIMYRGFLIWYLSNWLEVIPAAAIAAVIFGFGHAYQGWRGVLLTAAVGAFLGAVYLVSGSLFASMLIHALMDIHSGHLAMVAFKREEQLIAEERARREAEERERAEQSRLMQEQEAVAAGDHSPSGDIGNEHVQNPEAARNVESPTENDRDTKMRQASEPHGERDLGEWP